MITLKMCIIVFPLVFLAGFIDSVAGGGGVISLPAFMLAGLPAYTAAGTNKFTASCGTLFATVSYLRRGKVVLSAALISAVGSLVGSFFGTKLALSIPEQTLKYVMMGALIVVAVFLGINRNFGKTAKERKFSAPVRCLLAFAIGLVVGAYDGLIGPGTGTFLIICFTGILGMDLITSSGCAKLSNLASGIASAAVHIANGNVMFLLALCAAVFSIFGNILGARYAIKGGTKNVRIIMFVVLFLIFVKFALDALGVTTF